MIRSTKFKVFDWSIMSAQIDYRVRMEVIKCNTEVALETIGEAPNLKAKWLKTGLLRPTK